MEARKVSSKNKGYRVDESMSRRPGVPMESRPHSLIRRRGDIPQQRTSVRVFKRVGLKKLTPVFGTTQPPRGLSGILRSLAYKIPEHKAVHWELLLLSDRIDVLEGVVVDSVTTRPLLGVLAALGLAAWFGTQRFRPKTDF